MDLEKQFVKCSRKTFDYNDQISAHGENPCDRCESPENLDKMFKKQLGLIFYFGKFEDNSEKSIEFKKNTLNETSNNISVIYNTNFKFLIFLYASDGGEITEIVKEMMGFNRLPHQFVPTDDPASKFYKHQLTYSYLDRPLYPEVSYHYRRELSWDPIDMLKDREDFLESLDHIKKFIKK